MDYRLTRHKFRARPEVYDGIHFSSQKEKRYYQDLCIARSAGTLLFFLRQVPFHLPGGVRYVVDFAEFWSDGSVRFVDVKGMRTDMYILKKKQVEAIYPITITEA